MGFFNRPSKSERISKLHSEVADLQAKKEEKEEYRALKHRKKELKHGTGIKIAKTLASGTKKVASTYAKGYLDTHHKKPVTRARTKTRTVYVQAQAQPRPRTRNVVVQRAPARRRKRTKKKRQASGFQFKDPYANMFK